MYVPAAGDTHAWGEGDKSGEPGMIHSRFKALAEEAAKEAERNNMVSPTVVFCPIQMGKYAQDHILKVRNASVADPPW
jgi:hypothetical protein